MKKLGPIQKKWVQTLREHPERQYKHRLGEMNPDGTYQACCLMQLHICKYGLREEYISNPDNFFEINGCESVLEKFMDYGLKDPFGALFFDNDGLTLSTMNDQTHTWPEIADFVESNPEKVFNKSY